MNFDLQSDIFDNFVDAICIIGPDLKIVYFNPSFSLLIGEHSVNHIKKNPINELIEIKDFDWEKIKLSFNTIIDSPPLREIAYKTKTHIGKLQITWKTLKYADGTNKVLIYIRDVSLEETLSRKYKEELSKKDDTIKVLDQNLFQLSLIRDVLERTNTFDDPLVMLRNLYDHLIQILHIEFAIYYKQEKKEAPLTLLAYSEGPNVNSKEMRIYSDIIKAQLVSDQHKNEVLDNYFWCGFKFIDGSDLQKYFVFAKAKKFKIEELNLLETICEPLGFSLDNRELFKKAMTDEMTSLYNHRYFKVRLENEIQEHVERNKALGLILLDIDNFKKFNDSYGHLTGDIVLTKVAHCLKDTCRSTDVAARYGGEEFACILPDIDTDEVMVIGERIRKAIEKTLVETDNFGILNVTASLGISVFPRHGVKVNQLIEAADSALYEAKRGGRNQCKLKSS
jgi:diguanylate cyclase (GGDEF)-like protein